MNEIEMKLNDQIKANLEELADIDPSTEEATNISKNINTLVDAQNTIQRTRSEGFRDILKNILGHIKDIAIIFILGAIYSAFADADAANEQKGYAPGRIRKMFGDKFLPKL